MTVNNEMIEESALSKTEALVSVIIPSFNVEKYIAETLDSVIIQQYKNWECLIIDDHSTDGTATIVLDYLFQDPDKFKFYTNPGKGACAARNFGITQAKGTYIKFLDSDDAMFDEGTLSAQVSFLQDNGLQVVFGMEHYFQDQFSDPYLVKKRGAELNDGNLNLQFFTRFPITSNFLVRASENLPRWSEKLKSGQEFHFLFMCLLNKYRFGFQNAPAAKIRIHNSVHRISNKTPEVYVQQTFDLINQLTDELRTYNYNNRDFLSAFNVWQLRWSFSALSVKNFHVFKTLQSRLLRPALLQIGNAEVRFLYRLNAVSPYLAFAFYEVYKKTIKRDVLRGSLQ